VSLDNSQEDRFVEPPAQETAPAIPRDEYRRRREARLAEEERTARQYRLIGNIRLVVVVIVILLGWLAEKERYLPVLLAFPAVAFVALVFRHARVSRACRRAARAAGYYAKRLAVLDDRWAGHGVPGTRYLDDTHPYALDLDLFGTGCLFELLCTARTRSGEDTLAVWLRAPATPEEVRERQAAVAELRPRVDLREELALLGEDVPAGVDLAALADWGKASPVSFPPGTHPFALLLVALTLLTLSGWIALGMGPVPFLAALLVQSGFALWLRPRVRQVLAAVEKRAQDLAVFAGVLFRIEREPVTCPRLRQLRAALDTGGRPPSDRIAELTRLIDWLNARRNAYFAPLAVLLLWTTQLAFAIQAWRRISGPGISRWLAIVGEFEALCALATYAYENPAEPFPELVADGPCFEAEGLGHPLLPRDRCVPNDLRLGGDLRLLVVSGSNMSGKSTLLRSVGINVVLALTGAPVRASRLRLSPLAIGATLRIQDSLQAGRSRFYAEIMRMRQLVDVAKGPLPLLFLLDEILHGTNSHDRRVGAEGVVRTLLKAGAIGLITTHDLALTHMVELLGPQATNVHFEDHMESGTMVFDYRMRPGVVQNSNALALMRALGIEV
jgi:hypothetical protein